MAAPIDGARSGALPSRAEGQRQGAPFEAESEAPVSTPDVPPPEVITVSSRRVACDGVGGALGHPRVWLELGADGVAECGYCDRRFVLATSHELPEIELLAPGVYEGARGH